MIIKFVSASYCINRNTKITFYTPFIRLRFYDDELHKAFYPLWYTQPIGNTKKHEYKRIAKGVRLTGVQMVIKLSRDSYEYN